MTGARWRKVLRDAVAQAEAHWFVAPSPERVIERLGRLRTPWEGPGLVGVVGRRLVFEGRRATHRTSLGTLYRVERAGALVWVRRHRAHDWLVQCATEVDARALADALR